MADADNKDNTSQNPGANGGTGGGNQDALAKQLAEIQEGLAKVNARIEEQAQVALAQARASAATQQQKRRTEENLYEPETLLKRAEELFDTKSRENKAKDMEIYSLAQEYPEIQTDTKLRAAVLEAQKSQPLTLQDTAQGYRLAVLEATSKAGIVAKSQRKTIEDSPDYDGTRRSAAPKKRVKVSDATLQAAALMGRDIEDPEVLARLEEAANRDTYGKYR